MTAPPPPSSLLQECWDRALHSFGTHVIFRERYAQYRKGIRWVAFLGILGPLVVGGSVLAFSATWAHLNWLLTAAAILGIAQLILSAWALAAKWDDALSNAGSAASANYRLYDEYRSLALRNPPDLAQQFQLLDVKYTAQHTVDEREAISIRERRRGMRGALWKTGRTCPKCAKEPASLAPTDCDSCGNF